MNERGRHGRKSLGEEKGKEGWREGKWEGVERRESGRNGWKGWGVGERILTLQMKFDCKFVKFVHFALRDQRWLKENFFK